MVTQTARLSTGEEVVLFGAVANIPWGLIRPMEGQPRTFFDQDALWDLARSIRAHGQEREVVVVPINDPIHKFQLVDGQRRWHAVQLVNIPMLRAIIREQGTAEEMYVSSVVSNFGKADHTPLEIAEIIRRLTEMGKTVAQIADICAKSVGWVEIYKRLLNLHPEVKARLEPSTPEEQRLQLGLANRLGRLSHENQLATLKVIDAEGLGTKQATLLVDRIARKPGNLHQNSRAVPVKPIDKFLSWTRNAQTARSKYEGILADSDLFAQVLSGRRKVEKALLLAQLKEGREVIEKLLVQLKPYMDEE